MDNNGQRAPDLAGNRGQRYAIEALNGEDHVCYTHHIRCIGNIINLAAAKSFLFTTKDE